MGQTIAEKILSNKLGRSVDPGELVQVEYDLAGTNDGSTPGTKGALNLEYGFEGHDFDIADPDRLVIVPDHNVPAHNEISQRHYNVCKEVAEVQGVRSSIRNEIRG